MEFIKFIIGIFPTLFTLFYYFKVLLSITSLTSKYLWEFNTTFIYGKYSKASKNSSILYPSYVPWARVNSAIIYSKIDEALRAMWKINFYSRGRAYRNIISLHKEKVKYHLNFCDFILSRMPALILASPFLYFVGFLGFSDLYYSNLENWISVLYIILILLIYIGSPIIAYYFLKKKESESYGVEERESDKLFTYLVDIFPDIRTERINDKYDVLKFKLNDFYNSADYLKNLKEGKRKFYKKCKNERKRLKRVQDDLCKKYEISPDYSYLYVDFIPPIVGGEYLIPKKHLLDPHRLQRQVKFCERAKDYLKIWGFIWFMFILLVLILVIIIIDIYRRFFI